VRSLNNYIINYLPNSDGSIAYEKFRKLRRGRSYGLSWCLVFENKNLSKETTEHLMLSFLTYSVSLN
jgi:hypothetical protein